MGREKYEELIFQLGDMARERLGNRPNPPRSMERVFQAEDGLSAIREEVAAFETQMNEEEASFNDFIEQQSAEKTEQQEIVKKWFKAVQGIEVRSRELRKKSMTDKGTLRYEKVSLKRAEQQYADLEFTSSHDEKLLATSRELIKKKRLQLMRKERNIEEMDRDYELLLTPKPGQPGAQGILAHKRILEMEDEFDARKLEHDQLMKELDEALAAKDDEVKAAEEYLDDAIFLLGEECYTERLADASLAPLYPKIDKAK
jgi:hypothetical protein